MFQQLELAILADENTNFCTVARTDIYGNKRCALGIDRNTDNQPERTAYLRDLNGIDMLDWGKSISFLEG